MMVTSNDVTIITQNAYDGRQGNESLSPQKYLDQRSLVNATDLEGASSMIAGLEHEANQILDKHDDVLALNKTLVNMG